MNTRPRILSADWRKKMHQKHLNGQLTSRKSARVQLDILSTIAYGLAPVFDLGSIFHWGSGASVPETGRDLSYACSVRAGTRVRGHARPTRGPPQGTCSSSSRGRRGWMHGGSGETRCWRVAWTCPPVYNEVVDRSRHWDIPMVVRKVAVGVAQAAAGRLRRASGRDPLVPGGARSNAGGCLSGGCVAGCLQTAWYPVFPPRHGCGWQWTPKTAAVASPPSSSPQPAPATHRPASYPRPTRAPPSPKLPSWPRLRRPWTAGWPPAGHPCHPDPAGA